MSPRATWIIAGIGAFLVLCALAVTLQWYTDRAHLSAGPTAWFAVSNIGGTRGRGPDAPSAIGGPFAKEVQCEVWLREMTDNSYTYSCQRLRIDDARGAGYGN